MINDKRQPGYYRVKFTENERHFFARLLADGRWQFFGTDITRPFDEVEITDPTPIDPNAAQQPTGQQFTSKDEVYAAHQAIVDALGGHRGKELDLLVKLAHTAIAGIHETIPQPTGQLTAEDILHKYFAFSFTNRTPKSKSKTIQAMEEYAAQQTAHLEKQLSIALGKIEIMKEDVVANSEPQPTGQLTAEELAEHLAWEYRNDNDPDSYAKLTEIYKPVVRRSLEYAAQQTAAKDEEIAALGEMFSNCVSLLQGFPIAEPGDFDIGGRHHDWYCKRCDLLEGFSMFGTGVLGWRQTKDDRIRELEAQLEASETCRELEATKDKDAQIKDLRDENRMWRKRFLEQKKLVTNKDARIAELENQITILSRTQSSAITEMKRVEDQRDEAVNLLKGARSVISSIKLSMMAHPDHEDGSEFDDMTSKAQDMEDLINNRLVNYFKS